MPANVSIEKLKYDSHIKYYERFFSKEDADQEYWHIQAAITHSISVHDELLKIMEFANILSTKISNKEAAKYLQYGVSRRAYSIWYALTTLRQICPPDRKVPMARVQVMDLARDINVIYIDVRGLLDNLAWSVAKLFDINASFNQVGLFYERIIKNSNLDSIRDQIETFKSWDTELGSRRNPSAHRIPLTVVPAFLNPSDLIVYKDLLKQRQMEIDLALRALKTDSDPMVHFKKAESLFDQSEKVGTFKPYFCHDEADGIFPIYPTIPEDIGQMIILADLVMTFIETSIG